MKRGEMGEARQWENRYKDLQALLEDRNKELSSLQEKYYQLENDISMRNIDAKFEPYVANNDIRDDDYSRQDYPYMGKSRHTRQAAEGYRSIPGQMLSETGYASELSDAELGGTYGGGTYGRSGSSGKSGNSRSDSIDRRKKANETREKVKALEKLKHQANSIQEGNNSNRNNLFVKWFSFLIRAKLNIKEINYMKICDFLIRVALMMNFIWSMQK